MVRKVGAYYCIKHTHVSFLQQNYIFQIYLHFPCSIAFSNMDPSLASTETGRQTTESSSKAQIKSERLTESVCKTPPSSEGNPPPRLNTAPSSRNGTPLPTKFKQFKWTMALFSAAVPLFAVSFLYIHDALIAQHPKLGHLLFSPSRTIFIVV